MQPWCYGRSAGPSVGRPPDSDRVVAPRLAHFPLQVAVRLPVVDELFLVRVPGQLSAHADGDDAEVADRDGAVADLGLGHRRLARTDTVEEVAHVVVADGQL